MSYETERCSGAAGLALSRCVGWVGFWGKASPPGRHYPPPHTITAYNPPLPCLCSTTRRGCANLDANCRAHVSRPGPPHAWPKRPWLNEGERRGAFTARCNSTRCVYWRSSDQTEGASGSPRMQGASTGSAGMQDQGPRCTSRCRSDVVRYTGDIARLGSTTPPFFKSAKMPAYPCAVAVIGSPLVGSPLFPGIGGSAITPRATHAGIGLP